MKRTTIIETIIFLFAVLFVYTGISKLMEYDTFKEQLLESPILAPVASLVALTLSWMEFLVIILMILPRFRLKGFYAAVSMMVGFTVYVAILLSISDKLPCSCGGIISLLSWPQHLIFNCSFIALGVLGTILQRKQYKENRDSWRVIIKHEPSALTK
jgi:hypothetical protein